jgi:type IV secretion system protein VirD4
MKTTPKKPRPPLLENVHRMLCEAETKEELPPDATEEEKKHGGRLKSGLRFHAAQMIASGHSQISSLAGRYVKEGSREIDSIISTGRTQLEWLLSEPMRSDLRKPGVNWSQMSEKPTTVFVMIPAHFLESQEGIVWLRLVTMSALRDLYARAGRRKVREIVFMLSEFAALGKLEAIEAARSQGRKYGIRLWPVLQDIHQLRDIYGPHGAESFAGQCQAVFAFAPGEWESAEWMSRRSGEEDVITESASESADRGGVQRSYSTMRRRRWPPEKILSLPKFHGLVWFHGQSAAVPVYAAPYWTIPACKRLARPDPYHSSGGKAAPGRKATAAIAAAIIAVMIGGVALLNNTSAPVAHGSQRAGSPLQATPPARGSPVRRSLGEGGTQHPKPPVTRR